MSAKNINTNDVQNQVYVPSQSIPYRRGLFFQAKREEILSVVQSWIEKEDAPFKYNKSQSAAALKERVRGGTSAFCFKACTAELSQAVVCVEVGSGYLDLRDVYRKGSTLDYDEYNRVFDAFIDVYVTEDLKKAYLLSIYRSYSRLSEIFGVETAMALEEWEDSCVTDNGEEFDCDMDLWCVFVNASYMYYGRFSSDLLRDYLKEYAHWPKRLYDKVEYFANLYDYSIQLLEIHDSELEEG